MAPLAGTVLAVSLGMSPLIAVLLLISPRLAKRYIPKVLTLIWLVIAVRLIIPYQWQAAAQVRLPVVFAEETAAPSPESGGDVTPHLIMQIPLVDRPGPKGGWAGAKLSALLSNSAVQKAAAALWLSGAGLYLAYHLTACARLGRRLRRWSRRPPAHVEDAYQALRGELGVSRALPLLLSSRADTPVLIGCLRPAVYLPDAALTDDSLEAVLRHELTHYRRRDLWYKLVLLLACSLHWFNPLVHGMAWRAGEALELACDTDVLRRADLAGRRRYGFAILSYLDKPVRSVPLSTRFGGSGRHLALRFGEMMNTTPKRMGGLVIGLVAALALSCGGLVACGPAPRQEAQAADNVPAIPAENREGRMPSQPDQTGASSRGALSPGQSGAEGSSPQGAAPLPMAANEAPPPRWVSDYVADLTAYLAQPDNEPGRTWLTEKMEAMSPGDGSSGDSTAPGGSWPVKLDADAVQTYLQYQPGGVPSGAFIFLQPDARPEAATVLAGQGGVVAEVGVHEGYGSYIIIRHASSATFYGFCLAPLVAEGDVVLQGDAIATPGHLPASRYRGVFVEEWAGGRPLSGLEPLATAYDGQIVQWQDGTPADSPALCTTLMVSGGSSPQLPEGGFIWPTSGGRATRLAGHTGNGIDIAPGGSGHPIYAAADGVVTKVEEGYTGYGHYIIIRHGEDFETLYAHNAENYVQEGDWVEQGQVIATIGRTGWATGNQLHFEVRRKDRFLDPQDYVGYSAYE